MDCYCGELLRLQLVPARVKGMNHRETWFRQITRLSPDAISFFDSIERAMKIFWRCIIGCVFVDKVVESGFAMPRYPAPIDASGAVVWTDLS